MKTIAGLLTVLIGAQVYAVEYSCQSLAGTSTELTILEDGRVEWFESSHSAGSLGVRIGYEDASFSEWAGYQQYLLTDFYRTDDSRYVLALESLKTYPMKAVVYFDNDDHVEEIEEFSCFRK